MEGSWLHTKWTQKWSSSVVSDSLWAMDSSLPGSSIHGIFHASILEWVTISFSRRSSQPRDWTSVSHIVDRRFTVWATREVHKKWKWLGCVQLFMTQNSPGQNTGVGSLSLLQGIFLTQELNWGLLHCRQILYQLSNQGSPHQEVPK